MNEFPKMPLLWELPRMNSYLIRVNPLDTVPREPFGDRLGPDTCFWDIETHTGNKNIVRLLTLRRQLHDWYAAGAEGFELRSADVQVEATLAWVIYHPQTPWGVGWRCKDGISFNTNPLAGKNMLVLYRGAYFERDNRGALELVGKGPRWLDADDYKAIIEQVRRQAS